MTTDNPARGALLVTGAALMFASMGMLVRFASAQLAYEQVVFFRNLFGFLVLVPIVLQQGAVKTLRTERLVLHVVRSLFGLAAMYCFFYAIAHLPLSDAVLLNFTAPLFIPFIAIFWLREQVTARVAVAMLIGFLGVLIILQPGSGVYSPAALVGLASGAFAAVYGWYFWQEVPSLWSIAGAVLIAIAGVLAMRRQNSSADEVAEMEIP